MKQGLTEIIVVLDRSGSMETIKTETISGFNSFIDEQKKLPGSATVTLAIFDDKYEVIHDGVDIKEVPALNGKTYTTRGYTALYDAIGKTINTVGERLSYTNESDRPEKVMFVIITDGHENASREFSKAKVAEMTKLQTDVYSWNFVYIGANQDSFAVSDSLNIKSAMNYSADFDGVQTMYASVNAATRSFRSA